MVGALAVVRVSETGFNLISDNYEIFLFFRSMHSLPVYSGEIPLQFVRLRSGSLRSFYRQ